MCKHNLSVTNKFGHVSNLVFVFLKPAVLELREQNFE